NPQLLRLVQLAARFLAGNNVAGLLADTRRRFAAMIADELFDLITAKTYHGAGDDEGLAIDAIAGAGARFGFLLFGQFHALLFQSSNELQVPLALKEGIHALCDDGADAFNL